MQRDQEVKSVRIPSSLLQNLKSESSVRNTSVNSLIVSILREHADYSRLAADFSFLSITDETLFALTNSIDDTKLIGLARELGAAGPKEIMLSQSNEVNLSALKLYFHFVDRYQKTLSLQIDDSKSKCITVTAKHNGGQKWTLFLENYFASAMESCFPSLRYEVQRSRNLLEFKIFSEEAI